MQETGNTLDRCPFYGRVDLERKGFYIYIFYIHDDVLEN